MKPDLIANYSVAFLLVLKVLLSVVNGTEITGYNLITLFIAAGMYHAGITTIAEYFTGQKNHNNMESIWLKE